MDWTAQIAPSYFNNPQGLDLRRLQRDQRNIITKAVLGL
jgi:hypothetical protein